MSRFIRNTTQDASLVKTLQAVDCRPNKTIAASFGVNVVKVMRAKAILNYGTVSQIDDALAGRKSIHSVYQSLNIPERVVSIRKQERGLPTYEQVSVILTIDATSKTGLRWLIDRNGDIKAGMEAGSISSNGYVYISVLGLPYLGHVMVHFLNTRQWPEKGMMINHINGDRSDNRVENLELITRQQNFRGYRQEETIGYELRGNAVIVQIQGPFNKKRYGKTVGSIKDAEYAVMMLKDYFIQKWPDCYPPSTVKNHQSSYTLAELETWVDEFMSERYSFKSQSISYLKPNNDTEAA